MTDLHKRTQPEFYADWRQRGLNVGAPEADLDRQIQRWVLEAKSLLVGKCPKCGAPSTRHVDYDRQQGKSDMPGAWVQYRCSTQSPPGTPSPVGACGFMVDMIESEAAN